MQTQRVIFLSLGNNVIKPHAGKDKVFPRHADTKVESYTNYQKPKLGPPFLAVAPQLVAKADFQEECAP